MNIVRGLFLLVINFLALSNSLVVVSLGDATWINVPSLNNYLKKGLTDVDRRRDDGYSSDCYGIKTTTTWLGYISPY